MFRVVRMPTSMHTRCISVNALATVAVGAVSGAGFKMSDELFFALGTACHYFAGSVATNS